MHYKVLIIYSSRKMFRSYKYATLKKKNQLGMRLFTLNHQKFWASFGKKQLYSNKCNHLIKKITNLYI